VRPVTTPEVSTTEAFTPVTADQVAPEVVLASVVLDPAHTTNEPVMAAGRALTVAVVVALQPVASLYVIVTAPAALPVITPVNVSTEATVGALLVHVPPVGVVLKVTIEPAQTVAVPIEAGVGLTVTVDLEIQPLAVVYRIVVLPESTPVTTPLPVPTDATEPSELLHAPPETELPRVAVAPTHTLTVPVLDAIGYIVTIVDELQPAPTT